MPTSPDPGESMARHPWWLLLAAVVVGADYALVGPWHLPEPWQRLLVWVVVAFGLQAWLGPAALPLTWGRAREALRVVAKVVGVGAIVCVVGTLGALVASHGLGLRWPLRPANIHHPDQYWGWFLVAVIWAPLIEELIYRGIVQARLRPSCGKWGAIAISGLTFWAMHWVSFERITSPHHLGAGLLLAWSYERSRSLLAPTILHAIGNLVLGTSDLVYLRWPQHVHAVLGWG